MEGDSRGFFAYQVAVDGASHLEVLGRLYLSTSVSFEPELGLTAAFYCTICFCVVNAVVTVLVFWDLRYRFSDFYRKMIRVGFEPTTSVCLGRCDILVLHHRIMLHDPIASFPSLGRKPSPSSSHLSAVLLLSCCPYFTN